MNSATRLKILIDSGKTVFRPIELQMLWQEAPPHTKTNALRMAEKGLIVQLAKGYYALNKDYNVYELANRIVSPSYVSFDSALFYFHVNFQFKKNISSAATLNYQKTIKNNLFEYFIMKESLFFNLEGIYLRDHISMACPERAVLDCFYFGFLPNIDDKEKLNIPYLRKLAAYYPKTVQKKALRL